MQDENPIVSSQIRIFLIGAAGQEPVGECTDFTPAPITVEEIWHEPLTKDPIPLPGRRGKLQGTAKFDEFSSAFDRIMKALLERGTNPPPKYIVVYQKIYNDSSTQTLTYYDVWFSEMAPDVKGGSPVANSLKWVAGNVIIG